MSAQPGYAQAADSEQLLKGQQAHPIPWRAAVQQLNLGQGVMMKQDTSQCCRVCCCQPNIHWTVHEYSETWGEGDVLPLMMFVNEDAPMWGCAKGRCCSYCYPGARQTQYTHHIAGPSGPVVLSHEKPCTCPVGALIWVGDGGPVRCPCCCNLPYLTTKDSDGTVLGTTRYICDKWICVPKFDLFDAMDTHIYRIRPDVCCCGCCVRCRCGGPRGRCCRVPFLIRDPKTHEPLTAPGWKQAAGIVDLWPGWKKACCTKQNMWGLKFPPELAGSSVQGGAAQAANADAVRATLLGATLLIDVTCFEQEE